MSDLRLGQRVRHRDYKGRRVTGTVRSMGIEDNAVMVTFALDELIVIPAIQAGDREIHVYNQHVPAHELAPFDDRDELMAELLEAAREAASVLSEMYAKYQLKIGPFASQAQRVNVLLGAAISKATGSAQ